MNAEETRAHLRGAHREIPDRAWAMADLATGYQEGLRGAALEAWRAGPGADYDQELHAAAHRVGAAHEHEPASGRSGGEPRP